MSRREFLLQYDDTEIPVVSALPPAGNYAGQVRIAPRWSLLASAPATVVNGQRFRLAGGTYGVEYLGVGGSWVAQSAVTFGTWKSRPVISLNGPDTFDVAYVASNLFDGKTRIIEFAINDTNPDMSTTSDLIKLVNSGGSTMLRVSAGSTGKYVLALYNGGTFIRSATSLIQQMQQTFVSMILTISSTQISITIGPDIVSITDFTGWGNYTNASIARFTDNQNSNRPLQMCCVKDYEDNILLDNYPCDDGTGLTVRNTTTPSRPGTITDSSPAGVWVYSWVPL